MASVSFLIDEFTGSDTQVLVTLEDQGTDTVRVTLEVEDDTTGNIGDVLGFFADFNDSFTLTEDMTITAVSSTPGPINSTSESSPGAGVLFLDDSGSADDGTTDVDSNVNLNGGGPPSSRRLFEMAVQIGTGGIGSGDDFQSVTFDLSAPGLDINDFAEVGVRMQSVGPEGSGRGGSSKLAGDVPCFLPGTLILTDNGEVPIEALKIGDRVQTADGALESVKWIGRLTTTAQQIKNPLRGMPILIKAGALGDRLPKRDLYVSPDHAMFVDGLLINAGALVNGVSIVKTEPTEAFTYYHVELDKHALIVAEGSATESYLPQQEDRYLYDNSAEYEMLYPNQSNMILWPLEYPRVSSTTTVPRYVRKNLMAIAEQLDGAKELQLV